MAELVIPAGFAKVTIKFGGVAVNNEADVTFGVSNDTDLPPIGIATSVATEWGGDIMPDISEDLTLLSILVKNGPNSTGPFAELSVGQDGGAGSESVSPAVSLLVQKRTALGGRHGRGRMFVPGIPRSATNGHGELNGANLTTFIGDFLNFHDHMEADDLPLVVLHGAVSPSPTLVTSLDPQTVLATQRRRQRR